MIANQAHRNVNLDFKSGLIDDYDKKVEIRLEDLKGYFSNKETVDELRGKGENPLIYKYYEAEQPKTGGHFNFGVTVINPGKIGSEYYLTRGHYHEKENTAEIYIGLKGEGLLLIQKGEKFEKAILKPGKVIYIPPHWAHRTVNTGNEKLHYFYMYPADAGHRYEEIRERGFSKLIKEKDGKTKMIDNPQRFLKIT